MGEARFCDYSFEYTAAHQLLHQGSVDQGLIRTGSRELRESRCAHLVLSVTLFSFPCDDRAGATPRPAEHNNAHQLQGGDPTIADAPCRKTGLMLETVGHPRRTHYQHHWHAWPKTIVAAKTAEPENAVRSLSQLRYRDPIDAFAREDPVRAVPLSPYFLSRRNPHSVTL